MKRAALGIVVALPLLAATGAVQAADDAGRRTVVLDAKGNPVTDPARDPHSMYHNNTYTCYWPGQWECHHWWNPDGTEQFFEVSWLAEGMLTLKTSDGMHDSFIANGQWCSHNAKGSAVAGTAATRALRGDNPADKPPDPTITNNNKNGCSPVVDAQPGDHWYKLHLNGHLLDQREQYSLEPGHH